ncbi:MAG: glycosyl transferase family 1 [Chitinophagaceae bacterium]|nr:glycosyl transferase family 1 [Chitinophagaceae bacterium]
MPLKIAILGTRGIPNNYGGFEQIAGYLSKGLVEKGHAVTVYNSHKHPYKENNWNGVQIVRCFDPEFLIGTAGQFIYDLNCILDTRKKNFDIILMLGYTSSSIWKNLYPANAVVITNMDGLEWKRSKYSALVRRFLLYTEKLAIKSRGFFIADSLMIKNYLDEKYKINTKYIPYGAEIINDTNEDVFSWYKIAKHKYFLLVARMEPENNIEMILDGFHQTDCDKTFVVIGNTKNGFGKYLINKYKNDERIKFAGSIFNNRTVRKLIAYSYIYFHGHSVGGTNPSLLEAMAGKAFIAAHNNSFNKSVLNNDAIFFTDASDINKIIQHSARNQQEEMMISNNYKKIGSEFNWPMIINCYEQFFYECYAVKNTKEIIFNQTYVTE